MTKEGSHWDMPWWHDNWEKIRQVIIMICSKQTLSGFFCFRHSLILILQGHPHQYLSLHSISGWSWQGRERIAPCHDGMTIEKKYGKSSLWSTVNKHRLNSSVAASSRPHITGPSSPISKVSLHWISGWSWQGRERIDPCHDGMTIEKKYGKSSLWSAVNKHCLNSSVAAALLSPNYRTILTNI